MIDVFDLPVFYFLPAFIFWCGAVFILIVLLTVIFQDVYISFNRKFGKYESFEDKEGVTYLKLKIPEIDEGEK